jgi:hypothetical protein
MLARIRKAVIAGLGAGISVAFGALVAAGSLDQDQITKAIGAGLVAALTVGIATYRVPNAPVAPLR